MGDKAVASHKTLFDSLLTYISVFIYQFSSLNPLSHFSYSNSQFSINSVPIVFGIKTWLKFSDKKSNFISKLWSPLVLGTRVKVRRKDPGIEERERKIKEINKIKKENCWVECD